MYLIFGLTKWQYNGDDWRYLIMLISYNTTFSQYRLQGAQGKAGERCIRALMSCIVYGPHPFEPGTPLSLSLTVPGPGTTHPSDLLTDRSNLVRLGFQFDCRFISKTRLEELMETNEKLLMLWKIWGKCNIVTVEINHS